MYLAIADLATTQVVQITTFQNKIQSVALIYREPILYYSKYFIPALSLLKYSISVIDTPMQPCPISLRN